MFITVSLFYSSSKSLLNISFIFSICASILCLRAWIIFTFITLNSFSGRFPISHSFIWPCGFLYLAPLSATYFSVISFHLTYCICGFLFVGHGVIVPLASYVWPLVGVIDPGACVGFLMGGTCAWTLVGGAESCPSDGQGHVLGCVLGCL